MKLFGNILLLYHMKIKVKFYFLFLYVSLSIQCKCNTWIFTCQTTWPCSDLESYDVNVLVAFYFKYRICKVCVRMLLFWLCSVESSEDENAEDGDEEDNENNEEDEDDDEEEDDEEKEKKSDKSQRRSYYLREHKPRTQLFEVPIGNYRNVEPCFR